MNPMHPLKRVTAPIPRQTVRLADERSYYERSMAVSALAGNASGIQLINPVNNSTNIALVRIEIVLTTAVVSNLGLVFVDKANLGTATAPVQGVDTSNDRNARPSNPSSQAQVANAWSVAPTLNDNYLRRQIASIVGESIEWTWDPEGSGGPPLIIPQGASLVLRETANAVTAAMLVNLRWQEQRLGEKQQIR